jgi:hypothetical protein
MAAVILLRQRWRIETMRVKTSSSAPWNYLRRSIGLHCGCPSQVCDFLSGQQIQARDSAPQRIVISPLAQLLEVTRALGFKRRSLNRHKTRIFETSGPMGKNGIDCPRAQSQKYCLASLVCRPRVHSAGHAYVLQAFDNAVKDLSSGAPKPRSDCPPLFSCRIARFGRVLPAARSW